MKPVLVSAVLWSIKTSPNRSTTLSSQPAHNPLTHRPDLTHRGPKRSITDPSLAHPTSLPLTTSKLPSISSLYHQSPAPEATTTHDTRYFVFSLFFLIIIISRKISGGENFHFPWIATIVKSILGIRLNVLGSWTESMWVGEGK